MLQPTLLEMVEGRRVPGLESDILELLLSIGHSVGLLLSRQMQSEELTLNEARVLMYMARTETWHSPSDIARGTSLARPTVSRTLERLERWSFVEHLGPSKEDRRWARYRLTDDGRKTAANARWFLELAGRDAFQRYSPDERDELATALRRADRCTRDAAQMAEWVMPRPRAKRRPPTRPPFVRRTLFGPGEPPSGRPPR